MSILKTASEEELAEIERRKNLSENLLMSPEDLLLEIRAERRVAAEDEGKSSSQRLKNQSLIGHDPEIFLKDIFSNSSVLVTAPDDWCWAPSTDGFFIDMFALSPDGIVKCVPIEERIDVTDVKWGKEGKGIAKLIDFLRGKRVISCGNKNKSTPMSRWFLRVVDAPDAVLIIKDFQGISHAMTTEKENEGFRIGDELEVKEKWKGEYPAFSTHERYASRIVVIGFTLKGDPIVRVEFIVAPTVDRPHPRAMYNKKKNKSE